MQSHGETTLLPTWMVNLITWVHAWSIYRHNTCILFICVYGYISFFPINSHLSTCSCSATEGLYCIIRHWIFFVSSLFPWNPMHFSASGYSFLSKQALYPLSTVSMYKSVFYENVFLLTACSCGGCGPFISGIIRQCAYRSTRHKPFSKYVKGCKDRSTKTTGTRCRDDSVQARQVWKMLSACGWTPLAWALTQTYQMYSFVIIVDICVMRLWLSCNWVIACCIKPLMLSFHYTP